MTNRYRAVVALTSLLVLAAAPVPHRRHTVAASPDLYSPRALRRARTILQLKVLELRKARLERVLRAIERGLPADAIIKEECTPGRMKHSSPGCV